MGFHVECIEHSKGSRPEVGAAEAGTGPQLQMYTAVLERGDTGTAHIRVFTDGGLFSKRFSTFREAAAAAFEMKLFDGGIEFLPDDPAGESSQTYGAVLDVDRWTLILCGFVREPSESRILHQKGSTMKSPSPTLKAQRLAMRQQPPQMHWYALKRGDVFTSKLLHVEEHIAFLHAGWTFGSTAFNTRSKAQAYLEQWKRNGQPPDHASLQEPSGIHVGAGSSIKPSGESDT